jgi:hypothetical protein
VKSNTFYILAILWILFFIVYAGTAEAASKEPKFSVVKVTGMDQAVSFKVVGDELISDFRKMLDQDFRTAQREWEAAKKEAKKKKEEFTAPRPAKPQVQIVSKGLAKAKADEACAKAEEDYRNQQQGGGSGEANDAKYSVLMITGQYGTVAFETATDRKVPEIKKSLEADYKAALKDWESRKKEAKKNKEKFEDPKPSKPAVKVVKKGLSEEKAGELRTKSEEDYLKKQSKKKTP